MAPELLRPDQPPVTTGLAPETNEVNRILFFGIREHPDMNPNLPFPPTPLQLHSNKSETRAGNSLTHARLNLNLNPNLKLKLKVKLKLKLSH